MVDVTKIKKNEPLTAEQTSRKICHCRYVSLYDEIKDEYVIDSVVIWDSKIFINKIGKEHLVDFDYVTDEVMIDKFKDIYQRFLVDKKKQPDAQVYQITETKYEWIRVTKLTGVDSISTPSIEIRYIPSDGTQRINSKSE